MEQRKEFDVAVLTPHPRNSGIYEDSPIDDLVVSIKKYGLKESPIVTPEGVVLSGHRRVEALKKIGYGIVECRVKSFEDPLDELIFLVTSNEYRIRTNEERIREGMLLEEVESIRAEERMKAGMKPEGETGRTRDIVGNSIGLSGNTYAEGKKVIEEIDRIKEEDPEKARKYKEALKTGVNTAKRVIKEENGTPFPAKEDHSLKSIDSIYVEILAPKRALEIAHKQLKKKESRFTPRAFSDLISEIENMIAYLAGWSPDKMVQCDICNGTGKASTPQGHTVKCNNCINGMIPGE